MYQGKSRKKMTIFAAVPAKPAVGMPDSKVSFRSKIVVWVGFLHSIPMFCGSKWFGPKPPPRNLGGGFQICFIFTPNVGEDEPILTSIFFRWVGSTTTWKPETCHQKIRGSRGIFQDMLHQNSARSGMPKSPYHGSLFWGEGYVGTWGCPGMEVRING